VNFLEQITIKLKEGIMNLVTSVFEIAEQFMYDSKYVEINDDNLEILANDMKLEEPEKFPIKVDSNEYKSCLLELIGNSINYCYWYGSSDVRPLDASSGKMYELVEHAFERFSRTGGVYSIDRCLDDLIKYLSLERFPLLEERIKHLNELRPTAKKFITTVRTKKDIDYLLNLMVQSFPGYASDIFLKRAFLFFTQLNRKYGWFEEIMHFIPVPADYQVPKMLEYYGVLVYDQDLKEAIESEQIIPKGSLVECEIRASTIIACQQLYTKTGWTMPQIDGYLWLRRKKVTSPFHLTVTTDY